MIKGMDKMLGILLALFVAGIWIHLSAAHGLAAEEAPQWRGTYDIAMRWLNFIILAGVIIKYARTPLTNFLKHRQEETRAEIDELQEKQERLQAKVAETVAAGQASSDRLIKLKERIIAQGQQRRNTIIDDAKRQRTQMLADARRKVGGQIDAARRNFAASLIDSAFDLATQRLPGQIAAGDDRRFVDRYMEETGSQ